MQWVYDDGGRADAGYQGKAGDCVVRSIAIAARMDYGEVYGDLARGEAAAGRARSARNGVHRKVYEPYLLKLGFTWVPVMGIGTGCTMHLADDELPWGRLVVRCSRHVTAVIDGVLHDTYDCTREGTRCVYGYYVL